MPLFTVRADIHLGSQQQWDCQDCPGLGGQEYPIPITIKTYRLDWSPNFGAYMAGIRGIDPDNYRYDSEFPYGVLMVETEGEAQDRSSVIRAADQKLEALEWLLRLFQPGNVSVRRHGFVLNPETGGAWVSFSGPPRKPIIAPLYDRPPYHIHVDTLGELYGFVVDYLDVVPQVPERVKRALARFNSSYEKRDSADRLTDLNIALEALFNDQGRGGTTAKIARRCAGWLKPPGMERDQLLRIVEEGYNTRSAIVHGRESEVPDDRQADSIEDIVRASLVKLMTRARAGDEVLVGSDLDQLILNDNSL